MTTLRQYVEGINGKKLGPCTRRELRMWYAKSQQYLRANHFWFQAKLFLVRGQYTFIAFHPKAMCCAWYNLEYRTVVWIPFYSGRLSADQQHLQHLCFS